MKKNKRKQWIIIKSFQYSFLTYTLLISLVASLIFYVMNIIYFNEYRLRGSQAGLPLDHIYFKLLDEQSQTLRFSFFTTVIVVGLVTFIYGLYMSNRIAGPIYRMKKYMESWSPETSGQELRFRKKDYFIEIADEFNKFCKKIREK